MANMHNDSRNATEDQRSSNLNSSESIKPEESINECWYPDSGATHHVTSNLQNLNLGNREYKGTQKISMAMALISILHTLALLV